MKKFVTTPAGLQRLARKLKEAQATYEAIVAQNPEAAAAGDNSVWHDNFAFEENQRQMHQWARRVRDLQELLGQLEVVEPPRSPVEVSLGTAVRILDTRTNGEERYILAGYEDGDLASRRISYTSPLGQALLGAIKGELQTLRVAGAIRELEILVVEPLSEEER